MIFHTPFPLNPNATSASGIRPLKMLAAFKNLGFKVYEVTGYSAERKQKIRDLKKRIKQGLKIGFLYSESSTMPTVLTDKHHLPLNMFLDDRFFKFCKKHGIGTGAFYRDIYWREKAYLDSVPRIVAFGTRFFYRLELKKYNKSLTTLFVPSQKMVAQIPHIKPQKAVPLPPASDIVETPKPKNPVSLFYVGALGHYYKLHETVRAVSETPQAHLTLCTAENLWQKEKHEYTEARAENGIDVVHASGKELKKYYDTAALGCLFLEPIPYREFAAPMKLYEYLGHGKPIIAAAGSEAGKFVTQNDIGWVLPYEKTALKDLFAKILADPQEYEIKHANVLRVQQEHTWEARAKTVANVLTGA